MFHIKEIVLTARVVEYGGMCQCAQLVPSAAGYLYPNQQGVKQYTFAVPFGICLLYTSDAADE